MPSRPRTTASRTEARRRARLEARGDVVEDEVEEEEAEPQPRAGGGFLRLIFPPAPPLPDKPDPLAGFTGSGWTRQIQVRVYLLRANPLAWFGLGVVAGTGYLLSLQLATDALGFVATMVMFGALVAAGWFGWQRPTLYGTAAAIVGYVLTTTAVLVFFTVQGAPPTTIATPAQVVASLGLQAIYQGIFGFVAGWYGGYLRRRQASLPTSARRPRR